MQLESVVKYFSPKGMSITDTAGPMSPDNLTSSDVMAALGMTKVKASFGLSAFLGKTGISNEDKARAVEELTRYAYLKAPKLVGKVAGRRMARCMQILATLAYEEYSHSAGTSVTCHHCCGKGTTKAWRDVVKYPGYIGIDGEEKIPPVIEREVVSELCQPCNGKGVVYKRCRNCKGTGKAIDRESTKTTGAPVIKGCERCGGKGYSRMPSSLAHKAVKALLPELTQSSWSRNWKPLYDLLVTKCDIEEGVAADEFQKVTK